MEKREIRLLDLREDKLAAAFRIGLRVDCNRLFGRHRRERRGDGHQPLHDRRGCLAAELLKPCAHLAVRLRRRRRLEEERVGDNAGDENTGDFAGRTLSGAAVHLRDERARRTDGVRHIADRILRRRERDAMMIDDFDDGYLLRTGNALLRLVVVDEDHPVRRLFGKSALQDRPEQPSALVDDRKVIVRVADRRLADVVHAIRVDERLRLVQRHLANRHREVGLRDEERQKFGGAQHADKATLGVAHRQRRLSALL